MTLARVNGDVGLRRTLQSWEPKMPPTQIRVPIRYYLRMAEVLAPLGYDLAQLIRELGLPDSLMTKPDATLEFSEIESLVRQVLRITGRTDLGFELGKLLSVSTHSIVGFGMLNSATVYDAMTFVARYFKLVIPAFRMAYRDNGSSAEIRFTPAVAMGHECLAFHLEAMAMAAYRDACDLIRGQAPHCCLHLSIPRPKHAHLYEAVRGIEVEFGSEPTVGLRLVFDRSFRGFANLMSDPNALKVAEDRCRAEILQATQVGRFADWVAMTLREVSEGPPSLGELAETLNISTRSLNRHLQKEGTSFREISGRVQHQLARERLTSSHMSITEIALSLGFNDPSNFTRAFRDREGLSPRAFRRQVKHANPANSA